MGNYFSSKVAIPTDYLSLLFPVIIRYSRDSSRSLTAGRLEKEIFQKFSDHKYCSYLNDSPIRTNNRYSHKIPMIRLGLR